MTRFALLACLLSFAAARGDEQEREYKPHCRPACLSLIGLEFTVPVNERDKSPTGGFFIATQHAHRADFEDLGSLMQRVPSLVYRVPNATAGGGPVFVDLTSAFTLPTAWLFSYASRGNAPAWLRAPAELLALPNSLYALHFGDHPLGYAFGFATSLYSGPGGLKPVSAGRFGVLFGMKYARFTLGAEQRWYAPKSLEMPEFSYLLQVDLLPPIP